MRILRFVAHLAGTHLLVVLGSLAGGLVAGAVPAAVSGTRLLLRLCRGEPSDRLWADFWRGWRSTLRRGTLVALPLWPALGLLVLDVWIVSATSGATRAALVVGLVVCSAYLLVVAAFVPRVVDRYADPWPSTWRFLALTPLLYPVTSLAVLVSVVAIAVVLWMAPQLAFLCGSSLVLLTSALLVDSALERTDAGTETTTEPAPG